MARSPLAQPAAQRAARALLNHFNSDLSWCVPGKGGARVAENVLLTASRLRRYPEEPAGGFCPFRDRQQPTPYILSPKEEAENDNIDPWQVNTTLHAPARHRT